MDTMRPEVRSKVMAAVRSKRNRSTECRLRGALVRSALRGWTLNTANLTGHPDFAFPSEMVAIFVDGCFWHGCPKCKKIPTSNTAYWTMKIAGNKKRDKSVSARLRKGGWKVLRIWEHELLFLAPVLARIRNALGLCPGH